MLSVSLSLSHTLAVLICYTLICIYLATSDLSMATDRGSFERLSSKQVELLDYGLSDSDNSCGERCRDCLTRIPYATLIATVMCCVGVGVFCGTLYRGASLTLLMFEQVFYIKLQWLESIQLVFVILGAGMGALGLMILFVGCLATGATRYKVYKAWRARVGGRVTCAVFMSITYILQLAWLLILCFILVLTIVFTLFWALCSTTRVKDEQHCIDFTQFDFLFPNGTKPEHMQVCAPHEVKMFCKDYVERAEVMFIVATASCFLVVISLIHFLMCLASNYAHIKDHEKLQDFQEMQFLHESDMSTLPKDRF